MPSTKALGRHSVTPISIEGGAIHMSFRTALLCVVGIFASAASFHVMAADLVHADDLALHEKRHGTVRLYDGRGGRGDPVPVTVAVIANSKALLSLPAIREAVVDANKNSVTVKNLFFDARASELGRRAADRMPAGTGWRARKALHDSVKARARENLDEGRAAGSGDLAQFDF